MINIISIQIKYQLHILIWYKNNVIFTRISTLFEFIYMILLYFKIHSLVYVLDIIIGLFNRLFSAVHPLYFALDTKQMIVCIFVTIFYPCIEYRQRLVTRLSQSVVILRRNRRWLYIEDELSRFEYISFLFVLYYNVRSIFFGVVFKVFYSNVLMWCGFLVIITYQFIWYIRNIFKFIS